MREGTNGHGAGTSRGNDREERWIWRGEHCRIGRNDIREEKTGRLSFPQGPTPPLAGAKPPAASRTTEQGENVTGSGEGVAKPSRGERGAAPEGWKGTLG